MLLAALGAWAVQAGCGGCSDAPELAEVVEASADHFASFEHFERWTQRTLSSDVALRGAQALREAVFAPLRRDPSVLWAQVLPESGPALRYNDPAPDTGAALRFMHVTAPALGRVHVALCEPCQKQRPEPAATCVVIARPPRPGRAGVRVAFCNKLTAAQAHAAK